MGSHEMTSHADSFEVHLPKINNPYDAVATDADSRIPE